MFSPQSGREAETLVPLATEVEIEPRDLLFINEMIRLGEIFVPFVSLAEREARQIVVAPDVA